MKENAYIFNLLVPKMIGLACADTEEHDSGRTRGEEVGTFARRYAGGMVEGTGQDGTTKRQPSVRLC